MADFNQLFSLGPGTEYTKGFLDLDRSRGVITAFRSTGVDTASDASGQALTMFPVTYPGDPLLPLYSVTVKLLGMGQAMFIGYYGRSRRGQWVNQLQIGHQSRTADTYKWHDDVPAAEQIDAETGYIKKRTIYIPQLEIVWSDVTYQELSPPLYRDIIGTINSNTVPIKGTDYSPGYLRFEGPIIRYDTWGAYDKWYVSYRATFDSAQWYEGHLNKEAGPPGVPEGRPIYPSSSYVVWPAIP